MSATRRPFSRVPPPGQSLAVSANGRYLVDSLSGVPVRIHGDAGWNCIRRLTLAKLREYADDRVARGFNTILCQLTNAVNSGNTNCGAVGAGDALPFLTNISGGTWDGDPNFSGGHSGITGNPGGNFHWDASFTQPNPTYWDWIDQAIYELTSRGLIVLAVPLYRGIWVNDLTGQVHDGWGPTIRNAGNTQSVMFAFGQYLGNRYKNVPRIIWNLGTDSRPDTSSEWGAREHKLVEGIQDAGDAHLWTTHWSTFEGYPLSSDSPDFLDILDVQSVYVGSNQVSGYGKCRSGYTANVGPTFMIETTYENESSITRTKLRRLMWQDDLSCVGGSVFGNFPIWRFNTGWEAAMDDDGSEDYRRLGVFLGAVPWHRMVPQGLAGSSTLVTAGGGTFDASGASGGADYVVASRTPDGDYAVVYEPDDHSSTFTLDMSLFAAPVYAQWFDPTNASYTNVTGTQPFTNSSTKVFTNPGNNSAGVTDWALRLSTSPF